jgi:endonuclease/exonuclease/phosphatase family metal-dependent hydrolase
MITIIKMILWIIIGVVVLFGGFILFITLADYKPDSRENIAQQEVEQVFSAQQVISVLNWNIGYAGLGKDMDFFYDGGKNVRPSREYNRRYLDGIKKHLAETDADIYFLQEVDVHSRRSYGINQVAEISKLKPGYEQLFALNYKVPFVPVPVSEPMGKVKGGLMILSRYQPVFAERVAYPLIASWPDRLFLLDRCFILARYPLDNGKELVVMNTHNSAYVYDTALRDQEFNIIRLAMLEEYSRGNYVIAGGDWNANPPSFKPGQGFNGHKFEEAKIIMDHNFLPPDWTWAFDDGAPTNRNNDKPFTKGDNGTTVIDHYILSPNVELLQVENTDLLFENSDHNPVFLKVKLK